MDTFVRLQSRPVKQALSKSSRTREQQFGTLRCLPWICCDDDEEERENGLRGEGYKECTEAARMDSSEGSVRRERKLSHIVPVKAQPVKKIDQSMASRRWMFNKQHGLILAVVSVTAVGAAALFSFAKRTEEDVRLRIRSSRADTEVSGTEESLSAIKKAFESNAMPAEADSTQYLSAPSARERKRALLCRFSPRYRSGVYPYGLCTHLILASVENKNSYEHGKDPLFIYDPDAFRKFTHVQDTSSEVKLLMSVHMDSMLRGGSKDYDHLANDALNWVQSHRIDGLHLSGIRALPRTIGNITAVVQALRKAFRHKHLITLGIDQTQKTVEEAFLKLLSMADMASFRTSQVVHKDERTTLINPYRRYDNSTANLFLEQELEKLASMARKARSSHICFTLILGGNKFTLENENHHGLGAPAKHSGDAAYDEICNKGWEEMKYVAPAMAYYARRGSLWIAYDTEKTIADKVRLAVKKHPDFCVMLTQVDRDDYKGSCAEKHFPLVQSVKHVLQHA
ncbi:chitinase-3-like protein 1 [Ornithodoros turicata]|uniref:chitinase-3-like protein 1 n=1 Tax=Ornithodoros turicata TaxID=34597 RepID=UPI0031399D88